MLYDYLGTFDKPPKNYSFRKEPHVSFFSLPGVVNTDKVEEGTIGAKKSKKG